MVRNVKKQPAAAMLVLEDGSVFEGQPFGAHGEATGEVVLFTGVVGYQEVITDPSYRGTMPVMTYPIIGSYGINTGDSESPRLQVSGLVISEYSAAYSNFRATRDLEGFLAEAGVVGIRGIDTRAVAVRIREQGEMKALIVSKGGPAARLQAKLAGAASAFATDLTNGLVTAVPPAPAAGAHVPVALVDLGVKQTLLDQLAALGARVSVHHAGAGAERVLAGKPAGVIIAGGPGDPHAAQKALGLVRALLGQAPLLGVGLGCQVLALALGGRVTRMKIGHHGLNYPVRSTEGGPSAITAQHHSFAVEAAGLPEGVVVTHVNVNDGTVEGIACADRRARGVQFHPHPDEAGRPAAVLAQFLGAPAKGPGKKKR